jgi:hypothetical protein
LRIALATTGIATAWITNPRNANLDLAKTGNAGQKDKYK